VYQIFAARPLKSDHFHVKKNMPKIGGFQSFPTAKRTIAGFEAILWLKKGFALRGMDRSQTERSTRLCLGLQMVNKA